MQAGTSSDDTQPQISGKQVDIHGGAFLNAHTINYNGTNGDAETLERLRSKGTTEALHTSQAVARQNMCTPGTRTDTLDRLRSLARSSDPDSPDVVWMHGPAGAGKSAIMRTLADDLAKDGLLLATFFFFRSENQRNNSTLFIPTLAAQACDALPATQSHIAQAIQRNHDVFDRPAHGQAPILLAEPLVAAAHHTSTQDPCQWMPTAPLTIIVDGLDECIGTSANIDVEGQAEIINAMVQLASSIRTRTNHRIKIFIASRPEYHIEAAFRNLPSDKNTETLRLTSDDAEIHLFYEQEFDKIRKKFRLPPSWPSEDDVRWLADKTSGQYSFAGLSTRFLYGGDPEGRLRMIREGLKDNQLKPFEALDQLYATILQQVPEDMRIRALLALRWLIDPRLWRTKDVLEPFLQLPRGYVESLRPYLSSLVDFDNRLNSYHASLADFLLDRSRSEQFGLYIDDHTLSHVIQRATLAILGEQGTSNFLDKAEGTYCKHCQLADHALTANKLREESVCSFWVKGEQLEFVMPYPLPSTELTVALKKINPSSVTIGLSMLLWYFLKLLQKQFQSQRLYLPHPLLWYTIQYTLPNRVKLQWERRTASYLHLDQDQTELAFGFALAVASQHITIPSVSRYFLPIVVFPYFDKEFLAIDTLQGWNLQEANLHLYALATHLQTSPNMGSFWRYVHVVLQYISERSYPTPIRQNILPLFHSVHSDYTSELCWQCENLHDGFIAELARGIGDIINCTDTPVQPQEAVTLYCFMQDLESGPWWGIRFLVADLDAYTLKCLSEFIFLFPSQRRELVKIHEDLVHRKKKIGAQNTFISSSLCALSTTYSQLCL